MPDQIPLAEIACWYETAIATLAAATADPGRLSDAQAKSELLSALTHGAAMVAAVTANEPLLMVDALARGAGRHEVARALRIEPWAVTDRLIRWADRELDHGHIDHARHAEIERLAGAR